MSGSSTPLSNSNTVRGSSPPSPKLGCVEDGRVFNNPRVPSSNIIEYVASRASNSSAVYIYDLAEHIGFGALTKTWSTSDPEAASVVTLQTRAGAALSLVGRLSEGTSKDGTLTAYTSPSGLAMMASALIHLPPATSSHRLVLHIPSLSYFGDDFSLSPSLSALATTLPILSRDFVILLSASPQESADFAQLAYHLNSYHVIHIFDHLSSSREIGHDIRPLPAEQDHQADVSTIINRVGYSFFSYVGDPTAQTVFIMMNGPVARVASTLATLNPEFGVLSVIVPRPWNDSALLDALPRDVRTIHVIDDVPNGVTQAFLYTEVLGTIATSNRAILVHSLRVTPHLVQSWLGGKKEIADFFSKHTTLASIRLPSCSTKQFLLFGTPSNPLSLLGHTLQDVFLSHKSVSARFLVDHDVVTKSSGIFASRILLTSGGEAMPYIPASLELPLHPSTNGDADFVGVLDASLLRTHSLIQYCKPRSTVLCVTTWSSAELISSLPSETLRLVAERNIRLFVINAKAIADAFAAAESPGNDLIQNFVAQLAFLRLYLGSAAQESLVLNLALGTLTQNKQSLELSKINAQTWVTLEEADITTAPLNESGKTAPLRQFQFNAVAVEEDNMGTSAIRARLGCSWHGAAKHLLFPSVFSPALSMPTTNDSFQNPSLRPEIPDHTYLITCTVNRRLTPMEYDRNVFHLEFDTGGTGLKYAIGEALGIHGWNDEQEVLDFCVWYGVDPNHLITIPVSAGEEYLHTRTVFQSLQQQIDIFGRPPKSFYSDLAAYAMSSIDKHALLFIGSPEGSATFKKLAEKDTVTFVDVLKMYPSAKPGIERLCELVGDIKPRHYSIASAQSVVGDRVDLLVVTVDWVTPSGNALLSPASTSHS